MKYSKLFVVSALLYGANAVSLGDISLNQRKLFAQSLKQTGANIQLYDNNKSAAQNDKEVEELNMHLMQVQNEINRSSLDDPIADRTQSVIAPQSARELENEDWLYKNTKKKRIQILAQKIGRDDPAEDYTVSAVAPQTVEEENLTVWLAQKKRVNNYDQIPGQKGFIQMRDNLGDEYAIYAADDDDADHQLNQAESEETGQPSFFGGQSLTQDEPKKEPEQKIDEFNEVGEKEPSNQDVAQAFSVPAEEKQPEEKPQPKLVPKQQHQEDEQPAQYTPNLSQLNIGRAFGIYRVGQFEEEFYGDGEA